MHDLRLEAIRHPPMRLGDPEQSAMDFLQTPTEDEDFRVFPEDLGQSATELQQTPTVDTALEGRQIQTLQV